MRAVDIKNGKGPSENLFITDQAERPSPKAGEVLVKIKAFGLNRMDLGQREGVYPLPPHVSKTLGVEFSGTIEELGDGVSDFKQGDKVFGLAYGGAYAEYIAVSAKTTLHLPSEVSFEQAAGIPEVWFTAVQALYLVAGVKAGDRVLVHAGASGVGIAAIQLAVAAGAKAVYATAGSAEKCKFLEEKLGAKKAINYKVEKFDDVILKDTNGEGANVILDFIGKDYWNPNLNVAAKEGRIVLLGLMSGSEIQSDLRPILMKRLRIEASSLRARDTEYQYNLRKKVEEVALENIKSGKFKLIIEKVYDWKDVKEAHDHLASNSSMGKIICKIE